ncbi:MAG: Gfo/Idh/MocA family oxidoreductase [Dehalococcoidia bacterium]
MTEEPGRPLRAAVIGLGSMGVNHARVYGELETTELAAVCDVDTERLGSATRGRSARGYQEYRELLARESLDLLSVAVPTGLHREVALAAIERGVPLLVEKPIAAGRSEGEEIARAAREAGVPLMVGHVERFNPAIQELKRRLEGGELGRVFQMHARRVGPFPKRVRDVGVVLDLAPHDIDVMRFLLGSEVERVHAETERRINTDQEDMLSGLLRFRNGAVGVLDVNWLTPTKIRQLSVLGERGMFAVDYLTQELRFYENDSAGGGWPSLATLTGVSEGAMVRLKVEKREPLRVELEAFARAVMEGSPPPVGAEDALAALEVAEALVRAAQEGRVVAVRSAAAEGAS